MIRDALGCAGDPGERAKRAGAVRRRPASASTSARSSGRAPSRRRSRASRASSTCAAQASISLASSESRLVVCCVRTAAPWPARSPCPNQLRRVAGIRSRGRAGAAPPSTSARRPHRRAAAPWTMRLRAALGIARWSSARIAVSGTGGRDSTVPHERGSADRPASASDGVQQREQPACRWAGRPSTENRSSCRVLASASRACGSVGIPGLARPSCVARPRS